MKGLEEYISSKHYLDTEKKKINEILENYKKLINDATSGKEINELYSEALREFGKIKTKEQLDKEKEESNKEVSKKELESSKTAAKSAVKDSIAGNKYYTAERERVEDLLKEYYDKINSAKTLEAVEQFKKDAISEIAKIKTSDEKDEESKKNQSSGSTQQSSKNEKPNDKSSETSVEHSESSVEHSEPSEESSKQPEQSSKPEQSSRPESLPSADNPPSDESSQSLEEEKSSAINAINNYLNINLYYENQQNEIHSILSRYEDLINSSSSSEEINGYISSAKTELDMILTSEEIDSLESSVEEQTSAEAEE